MAGLRRNFGQKKARQVTGFIVSVVPGLVAGTAIGAAFTGLRFVDLQVASLAVGSVQRLDGLASAFVVHFNEAKATGAAGFAIFNDVGGADLTILGKHGVQICISGRPGQITNIDVLRQDSNSKEKKVKRKTLFLLETATGRIAK
jgi:hypothetical protein